MEFMKNVAKEVARSAAVGTASVVGMLAGYAIWENGLGDVVRKGSKKVFSKKRES